MSRPFFAFSFQKQSDIPLYLQLSAQLRKAISLGAFLQNGDQLVSLREMKTISGCSLETVKKAYDHLVAEGDLEAVHGKGYFVTPRLLREPVVLGDVPLFSALDSTPAPTAELVRRLRQHFLSSFEILGEDRSQATRRRQQAKDLIIAHEKKRGVPLTAERVLLFNRSRSGLAFLVSHLMKPGDVVYLEEYTYPPLLAIMQSRGVIVRLIPFDDEGISLDLLKAAHETEPADWLLIQPHHHFPTGLSYSRKRKLALLAWAEETDVSIIENDHHGDLWFQRPSRTLYRIVNEEQRNVSVYYIHSFSKTLSRELMLGLLALPVTLDEAEVTRLSQLVSLHSLEPSLLVIEAVSHILCDPWLSEQFLPERRAHLAAQWQMVKQAADQLLPSHARLYPVKGGLNTWIHWGEPTIHADQIEERVVTILRAEGIEIAPGYTFGMPSEAHNRNARIPALRFPLSPWGPREMLHWLSRIAAILGQYT
ncbi:PLP-dependent aminotransferase family protein [Brevibacillus dissolubilis]|uniref:aminotransferase-like domain-containing protein n=1 Tax=Brevibacillus dissolubilis TaxID=1844116 RepID=UPI0011166374|nr:PLP-dependent aminotransferase family protein [Brevibacillus dissolubilis]